MADSRICCVDSCNKPEHSRGYCSMHYWRLTKHGSTGDRTKAVRSLRVDGVIAHVPLTRGLEAIIDASDAHLVEGRNWRVMPNSSGINYVISSLPGHRRLALHRHLMMPPDDMIVDHINGDALDNRRSNLRIATQSQNCMNKKGRKSGSSRFKGVSWVPRTRKWQASIRVQGKQIYLGQFDMEEAAYASYCNAASEHHGNYARF